LPAVEEATMSKRLGILLLALGLCVATGPAPAGDESASKDKRTVYVVKYGAAKDLANVLGKHFRDAADIQVLPDSPSNCLLIRAAPPVFDEVVKVLEQLDRKPRLVSVEVLVAGVVPRKGEDNKGLDENDFNGPKKEVEEKIQDLLKHGQLSSVKRVQVSALENQQGSVLVGDLVPFVIGMNTTPAGQVSRTIQYRNTGVSVKVTPHITPGKTVQLDLMLEDARGVIPPEGVQLGVDENKNPIRAPEFVTSKLDTKLEVPPGRAVAAKGVKTESKSVHAQTLVIVMAEVVEPRAADAR
jgi:type II secretory pathway component GspD/PulD (secretin)